MFSILFILCFTSCFSHLTSIHFLAVETKIVENNREQQLSLKKLPIISVGDALMNLNDNFTERKNTKYKRFT